MEQHFFAVVFDVPFEVLHLSVEALSFNVFHDHGRELSRFDDPEDAFSLFVRHDDMVFGEREFGRLFGAFLCLAGALPHLTKHARLVVFAEPEVRVSELGFDAKDVLGRHGLTSTLSQNPFQFLFFSAHYITKPT